MADGNPPDPNPGPGARDRRSLRAKIVASAKLSSLNFATTLGTRLISTTVLTRLLAPEVYGVFAIVTVYLYLLEMLSDLGLRSLVLTYEKTPDAGFLRSCWTVSVIRGGLIALASSMIGAVIWLLQQQGVFGSESAYSAAALPFAIAALGGANLIKACQTPMRYMAERDMRFDRVTILNIVASVAGLAITIGLAFALRSIWALVLGSAIGAALQVILAQILFPGLRPSFNLDRANLKLIVDRGKWIIGHSTLTALAKSADQLVLGAVMTSSTFGFYFVARQLVGLTGGFLNSLHSQMDMQIFREMLRKPAAVFRRDYYRYRMIFDATSGITAGGLIVVAPLLVGILYDDRYTDVGWIMRFLAVGPLMTGPLLLRAMFGAERRFRAMTILSLMSTVTLWVGLGIAVFALDSIETALVFVALYRLPEAMILWYEGARRGFINPLRETLPLAFFAVGAGLGAVVLEVAGRVL